MHPSGRHEPEITQPRREKHGFSNASAFRSSFRRAGALIIVAALNGAAADPTNSFIDIDFPGATNTYVSGINNLGDIVGYYLDEAGSVHGFLRDDTGFTTLDFPGERITATEARGINDAREIVGYVRNDRGEWWHFLYRDGAFASFTARYSSDVVIVSQVGINDDGVIAGTYRDLSTGYVRGFTLSGYAFSPPFLYGGEFTPVVVVNPTFSQVHGINNRNHLVGDHAFIVNSQPSELGYVLAGDEVRSFQVPGAERYTYAYGINDSDDAVGYYVGANGTRHGYLWSEGTFTTLDVAGAVETYAYVRDDLRGCQQNGRFGPAAHDRRDLLWQGRNEGRSGRAGRGAHHPHDGVHGLGHGLRDRRKASRRHRIVDRAGDAVRAHRLGAHDVHRAPDRESDDAGAGRHDAGRVPDRALDVRRRRGADASYPAEAQRGWRGKPSWPTPGARVSVQSCKVGPHFWGAHCALICSLGQPVYFLM